jgi:hypothetical protein
MPLPFGEIQEQKDERIIKEYEEAKEREKRKIAIENRKKELDDNFNSIRAWRDKTFKEFKFGISNPLDFEGISLKKKWESYLENEVSEYDDELEIVESKAMLKALIYDTDRELEGYIRASKEREISKKIEDKILEEKEEKERTEQIMRDPEMSLKYTERRIEAGLSPSKEGKTEEFEEIEE